MTEQEIQKQKNSPDVGKLHPKEVALILAIRNEYRYGVIEVQTKDGLPHQILKTIERRLL